MTKKGANKMTHFRAKARMPNTIPELFQMNMNIKYLTFEIINSPKLQTAYQVMKKFPFFLQFLIQNKLISRLHGTRNKKNKISNDLLYFQFYSRTFIIIFFFLRSRSQMKLLAQIMMIYFRREEKSNN